MADGTSLSVERYSTLKKVVNPTVPKGPENVNITPLNRCSGRLYRAATQHNDRKCDL